MHMEREVCMCTYPWDSRMWLLSRDFMSQLLDLVQIFDKGPGFCLSTESYMSIIYPPFSLIFFKFEIINPCLWAEEALTWLHGHCSFRVSSLSNSVPCIIRTLYFTQGFPEYSFIYLSHKCCERGAILISDLRVCHMPALFKALGLKQHKAENP
jgi:hypothetical protein